MPLEWDPARGPAGELLLLPGAEQQPEQQQHQQQQQETFCPEMVVHREEKTEMILEGTSHGIGTLYVTSRRLAWLADSQQPRRGSASSASNSSSSCGDDASSKSSSGSGDVAAGGSAAGGRSIAIDYPSIVLHAVSRDAAGGQRACIYCQLKSSVAEEDEEAVVPELRFIPSSLGSISSPDKEDALDKIFRAMTEMAALNPDSDASGGDDDEDDFFVNSGDSLPNGWEFVDDKDGAAEGEEEEEQQEYPAAGGETQQQQEAEMEEEENE